MSGTLQLLVHAVAGGALLGLAIAAFHDAGLVPLIIATLFWGVAYLHFSDALWISSWGTGRDAVDRIGIAIKGAGFAMIAFSAVLGISMRSVAVGLAGLIVIVLGRVFWELFFVE